LSLLSKTEIKKKIETLEGWNYTNNSIYKEYTFDSYMDGIQYVNQLAVKAEENNHHPDIFVGWCEINLAFTSHDHGGVTQLCLRMAQEADKIFLGGNFIRS